MPSRAAGAVQLLLCCLLMPSIAPLAAQEYAPDVRDHMGKFGEFAAALESSEDTTDRRDAYRRYIASSDPAVHETFVNPDALPDEHFDKLSNLIVEHDEAIRDYHQFIRTQLVTATSDAERIFGKMVYSVPQHLTLNLGQSNAQVRLIDGKVTILYGIDTNAVLESRLFPNTSRDLRPTIAHELFHAYHWHVNPYMAEWAPRFLPPESDAPLWINIWSEGLANCAARHVYPDSDIAHVMAIEGIWQEAQPRMAELSARLGDVLDARDAKTTETWLYVHAERTDGIPNKAGYTLGTVVAHQIIGKRGFDAAVRLGEEDLRLAIGESLSDMAAGKVDVGGGAVCRPSSNGIQHRSRRIPGTENGNEGDQ
ncbi:MAG TPA: hypothetical protein VHG33_02015 [Woeseiaceae bacterium]|nr:hypothetical protein [Woeseiaceae bacterium]